MKRLLLLLLSLPLTASTLLAFTNPILPYDYSDPDVIQVGNDYYMTYSTFASTPGLQILQSRDMVNWTIVDAALPDTVPGYGHQESCPAGCGVWAPSIRYYNGRFYIYYGDPDMGIWCVRSAPAKSIPCDWEPAVLVKAGKGLIDPCPLWDADGRCYLVHAFAGSRAGIKSLLAVCELTADGLATLHEDRIVFDGHPENPTCEGPKFHRMDGYYYILCPAGGVKTGWQLCLRSRSPYGPYEVRRVLEQGETDINGPHQGAWVGNWFMHFQDVGVAGRIVHLQPLRWRRSWPEIGNDGRPMREVRGPEKEQNSVEVNEEFDRWEIAPEWQWNGNRKAQFAACHPEESYLRLFTRLRQDEIPVANMLLRKIPAGTAFQAEARVRFTPYEKNASNEEAGLVVYCREPILLPATVGEATGDKDGWCQLRMTVTAEHTCTFYRQNRNGVWEMVGTPFRLTAGQWIGARVGFYAISTQPSNDAGYLDIDWFRLRTL